MDREQYLSVHLLGPEQVELRRLDRPVLASGEIRVRIDAATTCGTDVKVFRRGGHPRMLKPPCPFGHEISATIIDVAPEVRGWSAGDRVVVANSASCGKCSACREGRENLCEELQYLNGAFAEELVVPRLFVERSLYATPGNLPAEMAALAEPLACVVHAYQHLRQTGSRHSLILGGGPIGLMFAFLMTIEGHIVTLADPNEQRLQTALELGAKNVHRITDRGHPAAGIPTPNGHPSGFEVAIDATGSVAGWSGAFDSVRPGGTVSLFGGCAPGTEVTFDTQRLHYQELTLLGTYHHRPDSFSRALEILAEHPTALQPLISSKANLEGVEDALRSMIERRVLKVAIVPDRPDNY
jgi:L-iditol 2-dehydrogenase